MKHYKTALGWWNKLSSSQKQDYEFKTFGYGDEFEDNRLVDIDIINMYKRWILQDNDIIEVGKKYSSVIADIYNKHHVNPYKNLEKHNKGIMNAMIEFAIYYNNQNE